MSEYIESFYLKKKTKQNKTKNNAVTNESRYSQRRLNLNVIWMKNFAPNKQDAVQTNHQVKRMPPFIRHNIVKLCTDAIHVAIPANFCTDISPVI